MANAARDHIKDINDSKYTWAIVARVLRKWIAYKKAPPYAPWRIGMLLVDEQGCRIEGFVTQKGLFERYKNELEEGEIYHFENFEVVPNGDQYRVTAHSWRLKFHNTTYFEESILPIPGEAYNFVPIKDIAEFTVKNEGLIDVMGFLRGFGTLQDYKNEFGISKRLNLTLADKDEHTMNVVLFGACAVNTFNSKSHELQLPIVVMVRFGRLNKPTAHGHITNVFEATKVSFNPEIPEAQILLQSLDETLGESQRFSQLTSPVNVLLDNGSLLTFPTRIRVDEILRINEPCEIVTKVCIQKVEIAYGWTYDGCACDCKPIHENDKLKCKSCQGEVLSTQPKFKVHYKVFDSTGMCSVIFFNRLASELIGFSAKELKTNLAKGKKVGSFPTELNNCVGKEMIVKLKIKENNIKFRNSSIGVIQFTTDEKMLADFAYSGIKGIELNTNDTVTHEKPIDEPSVAQYLTIKLSCGIADEANDLSTSQLPISPNRMPKRKLSPPNSSIVDEVMSLSATSVSTTSCMKPLKNIKKEK